MNPSGNLIEFLDGNPLPWLRWDSAKQKFILIADNHLLATYRACPQYFINAHVWGYRLKGKLVSGVERNWFLDFGVILHKMLELYYKNFRNPGFDPIEWIKESAPKMWLEGEMDVHAEHKEYKKIGGMAGFIGLLVQYSVAMSPENEKLRVLGTEVSFGQNLEVPLYIGEVFEMYLAGRMDLIVDDGYFICPMDHKTMGMFKGDPGLKFETEEGPTGYIYALKTVLKEFLPEELILKRDCTKILMNLICKNPTESVAERFKRIPIRKTTEQLIRYQERMISTGEALLIDMKRIATGWSVGRNTQVCQNWMHLQCPYFDVCRQGSTAAEEATLKNGFVRTPIWNTEEVAAS